MRRKWKVCTKMLHSSIFKDVIGYCVKCVNLTDSDYENQIYDIKNMTGMCKISFIIFLTRNE